MYFYTCSTGKKLIDNSRYIVKKIKVIFTIIQLHSLSVIRAKRFWSEFIADAFTIHVFS